MIQAFYRDFQQAAVSKPARALLARALVFLIATLSLLSLSIGSAVAAPAITTQPLDRTVFAGESVTFSVTATGATSYQWEAGFNGNWQPIPAVSPFSGVDTASLKVEPADINMNGWKFRVVVTGSGGTSVTSNAAAFTVEAYEPPVAITGHPVDRTVDANTNTTLFSVTAVNATGYQWQFSMDSGASWSDILGAALYGGATSDTLTTFIAMPELNGFQYRVVVSGAGGPVISAPATLTVNVPAPTIISQPQSQIVDGSSNATFKVIASNATTYQWEVMLPSSGTWIAATNAEVFFGGTTSTLGIRSYALSVVDGAQFRVVVTGQGGSITSQSATLTVSEPLSTDANLSALTLSNGTLSPAFAAGTTGYTATVPHSVSSITVTATRADTTASVTINGSAGATSGPIDLIEGGNTITVVVTAQDDTTKKTYTVVVTREAAPPSHNVNLSSLIVSKGTLSPAFANGTWDYSLVVPADTDQVDITATLEDPAASIFVDGSPFVSGSAHQVEVPATGSIDVVFWVNAASNQASGMYTITVSRAAPAMPVIATITPNEKLVTEDSVTATITGLNLSGTQSVVFGTVHATNLQIVDDTKIKVLVPHNLPGVYDVTVNTATGTVKATNAFTYKIPLSNKANLADLALDGAPLDFESDGVNFSTEVENTVESVAVIPTLDADSSAAKVTVNDAEVASGAASSPIPLAVGNNTITVVVTAEDQTTTKTYKITVMRKASATKVWSLTPKSGSTSGGETIIIGGQGLGAVTGITFGGVAATNLTIISDSQISVTTPPHAAQIVQVVAQLADSGIAQYTGGFLYVGPTPGVSLSPAAGALGGGTVGIAYSASIVASGGTGPYAYAVTSGSLPAGLTIAANGVLSGTPTAAENAGFTVTATDSDSVAGSANYTLAISPASKATISFTPKGGALPEAMAGEEYSQKITAEGGTGALTYSLASGSLPKDLVLNVSTGGLSGTLAEDTEGDYSFTIEARDGAGSSGSASFKLKVAPRTVTVTDKTVTVEAGSSPLNVNLEEGATGGPFSDGAVTFVEPPNAGRASIVRGEFAASDPVAAPLGWYLKFVPNPAFSGQTRVGFRLTSGLGASNVGTVTYNLSYDAAEVAQDVDALVHGFVQTRQNLIASTIKVPGLTERRRMQMAADPATARMTPSPDGITLGFATSLAQMEAARNASDGVNGAAVSPFNIWVDGTIMAHNREDNGGKWGSFAMVSLGADYLLTERALLGLSFHYDRMTDPTDEDAELTGNGWLAGPYVSLEIGNGVFWDTQLLYGGSSNNIDTAFWDGRFDTSRWLFDTAIQGRWNLDDQTVLTPKLRAVYLSEEVDDYAIENGAGDRIELDGFTQEQLRVSLGAEIERHFMLDNGMRLTPRLGGTAGFSGLDGSGAFGSVSAGVSLDTLDAWSIDAGLLFNVEGDGQKSAGAKIGVSGRF